MKVDQKYLEKHYLGKLAHVIYHNGSYEVDSWGTVTRIDGTRIYGTWDPVAFIEFGKDYIGIND